MNIISVLKQLISIDSTSDETKLAQFIENYIKSLNLPGLKFERQFIGDNNRYESVFKSSVNLAGLKGGLLNGDKVIWKGNQVPDYAEAMIEVRIGSNISQEKFEKFVKNRFTNKGCKIENLKINFYLDGLLQPELIDKYKTFGEIDDGKQFGYSDIAMIKKVLPNTDCLLLGPGPKSKAHQEDEYVEIDSLLKVRNIIKKVVFNE